MYTRLKDLSGQKPPYQLIIFGYLPIMPVNAWDSTGASRDKQEQGRDKQVQVGTLPFCPCLSLSVPVCPCLPLLVLVCPCLSFTSSHLKSFLKPAVPPIRLFLMINMMPLKRCVVKGNYFTALLRNKARNKFLMSGP